MRWKNSFGGFTVCAVLIIAGCLYLDVKLAEFVTKMVGFSFLLSAKVSNAPDLLFILVSLITVLSWAGRLYLSRKPVERRHLDFLEFLGCAVPLVYILKDILKGLFGRTNTRVWLLHPDQFGFHWFQGGGDFSGFPSGHMAVFTTLLLGVARYSPRLRPACAGLLLILALALIVTQYHFLSDIAAGVYLGLVVDSFTRQGLSFFHRKG